VAFPGKDKEKFDGCWVTCVMFFRSFGWLLIDVEVMPQENRAGSNTSYRRDGGFG
jgi:hypothetical protein